MRVINIIDGFGAGGVEQTVLRSLRDQWACGVEVIICSFCQGGRYREAFGERVAEIYNIRKTGVLFLDAVQLGWILTRARVNVVHSHFGFSSGGFALACWLCRVPIVVSVHSPVPSVLVRMRSGFVRNIVATYVGLHVTLTKTLASCIIGHSSSTLLRYCSGWREESKYRLIYNGVCVDGLRLDRDVARDKLGFSRNTKLVLHVGSFRAEKNHVELIRIFKHVCQKCHDVQLLLVGDGDYRRVIQELAEHESLADKVHFLGERSDVQLFYSAADVFLFPSKSEGLGNVIVEAQICGLPVVCSDIAPHREALFSLQHSNMFKLGEPVLAARIVHRLLKEGLSESIIAESRLFAIKRFSLEGMAKAFAAAYMWAMAPCGRIMGTVV